MCMCVGGWGGGVILYLVKLDRNCRSATCQAFKYYGLNSRDRLRNQNIFIISIALLSFGE